MRGQNSKIKVLKIVYILIIIIFTGCDDCPIKDKPPIFLCEVREATITEFNPLLVRDTLITDSVVYKPDPKYSVHTFEFPIDQRSSGSLPNDDRFKEQGFISVATTPSTLGNYSIALIDFTPLNSDMVGDILVDSVYIHPTDPTQNRAYLMFYGHLARFPRDFTSENSREFCNFLGTFSNEDLNNIRIDASQYGEKLPNAGSKSYDINSRFIAINERGLFDPSIVISLAEKQLLLSNFKGKSIEVEVFPGHVYFYRARNGRQFALVISDIKAGTFPPNKNRVTIMFNPLK